MNVSAEEVARIAALAQLQLSEEETARLAVELAGILDHMTVLQTQEPVPVPEPEPEPVPVPRADEPGADPLQRGPETLSPHFESGFFTVPRLPALDAEAGA